jgi:NAD(P)-dependent dehydrogenase (short-subunit alcohol dehydrogenase family)
MKKTIAAFGRLDYAFNNAPELRVIHPVQDCSEENWDKTIGSEPESLALHEI